MFSILFWACLLAIVLPAIYFGYLKIVQNPEKLAEFERWGYSRTFMIALGVVEILLVVAMLFVATREYAIYTYAVVLLSAIGTHLKAGEGIKGAMPPIFVAVLLGIVYWLM